MKGEIAMAYIWYVGYGSNLHEQPTEGGGGKSILKLAVGRKFLKKQQVWELPPNVIENRRSASQGGGVCVWLLLISAVKLYSLNTGRVLEQ